MVNGTAGKMCSRSKSNRAPVRAGCSAVGGLPPDRLMLEWLSCDHHFCGCMFGPVPMAYRGLLGNKGSRLDQSYCTRGEAQGVVGSGSSRTFLREGCLIGACGKPQCPASEGIVGRFLCELTYWQNVNQTGH